MTSIQLKGKIIRSLRKQGFRVQGRRLSPPNNIDKEKLRLLHAEALQHKIEACRKGLVRFETKLLAQIAAGSEVRPERISPPFGRSPAGFRRRTPLSLCQASLEYSGFRPGYESRIRFLVVDQYNGKLIGLFRLGDPVFSLGARDQWIGWNKESRGQRLHHVMDAFISGAVPPYSSCFAENLSRC